MKNPIIKFYCVHLGNACIVSNERILIVHFKDHGILGHFLILDGFISPKKYEQNLISEEDFFDMALPVIPEIDLVVSCFFKVN